MSVPIPLLLALGCRHPVAPAEEPRVEPEPVAVVAASVTPEALYARCRDRVEGPEREGECTTDAECATAGCSSEVCLPAVRVPEIMTTCEVLPCFAVLGACGCREGRCTWTLGDAPGGLPLPRIPRELPPRDP